MVIRIGDLHDIIALRNTDQHVAFIGTQRIAHESRRLRVPSISQALTQLRGKQLRELVFETLAPFG